MDLGMSQEELSALVYRTLLANNMAEASGNQARGGSQGSSRRWGGEGGGQQQQGGWEGRGMLPATMRPPTVFGHGF